jgi:hypothetical protein
MQVQASIPPADVAEAIRTAKVQLRSDIGDVGTAYAIVLDHLRPAVAENRRPAGRGRVGVAGGQLRRSCCERPG